MSSPPFRRCRLVKAEGFAGSDRSFRGDQHGLRAAGGAAGPLGAKKVGSTRSAETVSPRTSSVQVSSAGQTANAVEGEIPRSTSRRVGPVSSDLGFHRQRN